METAVNCACCAGKIRGKVYVTDHAPGKYFCLTCNSTYQDWRLAEIAQQQEAAHRADAADAAQYAMKNTVQAFYEKAFSNAPPLTLEEVKTMREQFRAKYPGASALLDRYEKTELELKKPFDLAPIPVKPKAATFVKYKRTSSTKHTCAVCDAWWELPEGVSPRRTNGEILCDRCAREEPAKVSLRQMMLSTEKGPGIAKRIDLLPDNSVSILLEDLVADDAD